MNRDEATQVIGEIGGFLHPWAFEIAGSYRRRKDEINDIDVISLAPPDEVNKKIEEAGIEVREMGREKTSFFTGGHLNAQVDIRFTDTAHFGSMLLYFTGSKAFNIRMRSIAKDRGLRLNEYGIVETDGKMITFETEKAIFDYLGLVFTAPFLRNGRGVVRKKKEGS